MIKKFYICLFSFACCTLFGAASSKQIGRVIDDPGCVHLVYDQAHPEISAAYVAGAVETDHFGYLDRQDTLIGFFVGHPTQSVRQGILNSFVEQQLKRNDENLYRPVAVGDGGDFGLSAKIACVKRLRSFALGKLKTGELMYRTPLYTAVLFMHCRRGKDVVDAVLYEASNNISHMLKAWHIKEHIGDPSLRIADFYRDEYAQEILRRVSARTMSSGVLGRAFSEWVQEKNIVGVAIDRAGIKKYFESFAEARSEN